MRYHSMNFEIQPIKTKNWPILFSDTNNTYILLLYVKLKIRFLSSNVDFFYFQIIISHLHSFRPVRSVRHLPPEVRPAQAEFLVKFDNFYFKLKYGFWKKFILLVTHERSFKSVEWAGLLSYKCLYSYITSMQKN